MRAVLAVALWFMALAVVPACAQAPDVSVSAEPETGLVVSAPAHSGGLDLDLSWTADHDDGRTTGYAVLRATSADGPWSLATASLTREDSSYTDMVTSDPLESPPEDTYYYRLATLSADSPFLEISDDGSVSDESAKAYVAGLLTGPLSAPIEGHPQASWIAADLGHLHLLFLIVGVGGLMMWFTDRARKGDPIFIRRIPGIDAIEEGIGRATEMGKPVLYVPGIDELQDIQTIASVLILGQVAETVAEYQSELIVSCCIPIVREVADEVVKAGFYQAGHPDAYNPANTRFISSEQFAFCAGTNGIILREKPATNIYLGRFFAESLILAETGFINKSIQIAGTAEATQLPFFIAACDYTLIGEELFAVSAYLSRDPRLVSSLKASDYVKVYCVICLVVGTLMASFGEDWMIRFFSIGG
jgi:hypothetical protein